MHPYTLDPGLQPHPGSTPIPITPMDLWSKRSPNGRPLLVEPWSFCNFIVHQRPWLDGGGACTLIPWTQAYNPTLVPHLSLSPPWTYGPKGHQMDAHSSSNPGPFVISLCIRGLGEMGGGGACTLIPWTQAYNPTLVPHLSLSPIWTYGQNSTKMDLHHPAQLSYKNDNNSPSTQPIFFDDGSLDAPNRALSNGDKKKSIGCAVEKI